MSARVLQLTLGKLFSVSITTSTQRWLTSTPTMLCGQAPNTPSKKIPPLARSDSEYSKRIYPVWALRAPLTAFRGCARSVTTEGKRTAPLAWKPFWGGGRALVWHVHDLLGYCVLCRFTCVFLVLVQCFSLCRVLFLSSLYVAKKMLSHWCVKHVSADEPFVLLKEELRTNKCTS